MVSRRARRLCGRASGRRGDIRSGLTAGGPGVRAYLLFALRRSAVVLCRRPAPVSAASLLLRSQRTAAYAVDNAQNASDERVLIATTLSLKLNTVFITEMQIVSADARVNDGAGRAISPIGDEIPLGSSAVARSSTSTAASVRGCRHQALCPLSTCVDNSVIGRIEPCNIVQLLLRWRPPEHLLRAPPERISTYETPALPSIFWRAMRAPGSRCRHTFRSCGGNGEWRGLVRQRRDFHDV